MINHNYELSSEADIAGRRHIKVVLHEIYENNSQWNKNGISWLKNYTQNNIESVNGMSLTAEFLNDEKNAMYGHGYTGMENNLPLFENATVVGHFTRGYVDTVSVDGNEKTVLIGEGIIDEMRYPKFVAWLEDHNRNGKVNGSVEIVGRKENHNEIIYDGGWKKEGRVPMEYDYSGYAILEVMPADDAAVVMEINSARTSKKEGTLMDNETRNQIIAAVKDGIAEMNTVVAAKETEFNSVISEHENKIAELDKELADARAELESLKKEREQLVKELAEANNTITEANAKVTAMENEKAINELNAAISNYTEAEQAVAKEDIEKFKAEPNCIEINAIVGKICSEIVRNMREQSNHEVNSVIDVFGMADDNAANADVDLF